MKASEKQPSAVFEVTALAKLDIFGPVIRKLRDDYGVPCKVIVSSEVHNLETDPAILKRWDLDYTQVLPVKIGSNRVDWLLYNIWLKRNAGRILDSLSTSVLVLPNDRNYPHHFYIDAAKRRGIPTILMQESLRKDEFQELARAERLRRRLDRLLFGIDSRLKKHGQGGCTKVAAWGETSRDYYLRVGVPGDRIVITGNPAFDAIASKNWRIDAATVAEQLDISADDGVIVFLTSPLSKLGHLSAAEEESYTEWMLDAFAAVVGRNTNRRLPRLVIKPHHLEDEGNYRSLIDRKGLQRFVRVSTTVPLYPLIALSDATMMFSTTAGLEAALLGKPVAIVDLGKRFDNFGFVEQGVGTRISTHEEFASYIASTASSQRREHMGQTCRRNAMRYVANLGTATEKVAQLISEVYRQACS